MIILKKLTLFMAATIAATAFIALSLDSFGFRSPISALVTNWMVLAWTSTITLVVRLSFPSAYYDARLFERTGRFYERVGIRVAKKFLRRGPLRILSPTLKFPKEKNVSALRHLENEMRKAETAHALTFIFMLSIVGYAATNGWIDAMIWILLFDILINVYPVMLQRYNRIKLRELIYQQDRQAVDRPRNMNGTRTNVVPAGIAFTTQGGITNSCSRRCAATLRDVPQRG